MAKVAKTNHLLFSIFGATAHPDRTSDSYVTLKKKKEKNKTEISQDGPCSINSWALGAWPICWRMVWPGGRPASDLPSKDSCAKVARDPGYILDKWMWWW